MKSLTPELLAAQKQSYVQPETNNDTWLKKQSAIEALMESVALVALCLPHSIRVQCFFDLLLNPTVEAVSSSAAAATALRSSPG